MPPQQQLRGFVASRAVNIPALKGTQHGRYRNGPSARSSPQEFLEELFEYEYCAECGGDAEDHIVALDVLGLFHAHCLKPPIF